MRFAKYWEFAKDTYLSIAYKLGLKGDMIDKIEHDFCNDLVMKMFTILTRWMEISDCHKRNCGILLNAANHITGMDHKHTLCRVGLITFYKPCKPRNINQLHSVASTLKHKPQK